jgi:hypothetical protein
LAPRFGAKMTSPPEARTFSASRSGVRDTPKRAHSACSLILSPGLSSPSSTMS